MNTNIPATSYYGSCVRCGALIAGTPTPMCAPCAAAPLTVHDRTTYEARIAALETRVLALESVKHYPHVCTTDTLY